MTTPHSIERKHPAPVFAPDRRAHREWLLSLMSFPTGGTAVDLGCGRGGDLLELAARANDAGARFVGVDVAESAIATARDAARAADDARVTFDVADLSGRLPFDDESVDLVFSQNFVECLGDRGAFVAELARILKPGGVLVTAHWDFDSQIFDGADKGLVRRLVHAFADFQQPWMAHADGWMGRRLWGMFASCGLFDGSVHARVLTNTIYAAPWYGHEMAGSMRALVSRGLATADEYARFVSDLEALDAASRYFYAITAYAYVGRRS